MIDKIVIVDANFVVAVADINYRRKAVDFAGNSLEVLMLDSPDFDLDDSDNQKAEDLCNLVILHYMDYFQNIVVVELVACLADRKSNCYLVMDN